MKGGSIGITLPCCWISKSESLPLFKLVKQGLLSSLKSSMGKCLWVSLECGNGNISSELGTMIAQISGKVCRAEDASQSNQEWSCAANFCWCNRPLIKVRRL